MPSRLPLPAGSAHAVAFLALVVAVGGGGYAVAQGEPEPQATIGYHEVREDARVLEQRSSLVAQLVFPTGQPLAVSAKLDVRKRRGTDFRAGAVTCFLGAVGRQDRATVTLRPGEAANLSLQSMGSLGEPGGNNAVDLYCESKKGSYVVANARISAVELDDIQEIVP